MKMRFVVIITLLFNFANCAVVNHRDGENPLHTERNRSMPELFEKHVGLLKSSRRSLQLPKLEAISEKQKRRCEMCRDSLRCKSQGKCDLCTKICKDFQITTEVPPASAPIVGNARHSSEENSVGETSQNGNSGRYYTLEAFGPGPKQDLLIRLLNITKNDNLDKLIVLAKAKGNTGNPKHLLIVDTADAFEIKKDGQKINAEIYEVNTNNIPAVDLDLTSAIERELDMAVQEKQRLLGQSHLTKDEVDKIIDHALSLINQKSLLLQSATPSTNSVRLESRNNIEEILDTTTKTTITNDEEDTVPHYEQVHEPQLDSEKSALKQVKANQLFARNGDLKKLTKKSYTEPKDENVGRSLSEYLHENNGKNPFTLGKHDSNDELNVEENGTDSTKYLTDYKKKQPYENEVLRNTNHNQHTSPHSQLFVPKFPSEQNAPQMIHIPSSRNAKPESANQYKKPLLHKMNIHSHSNNYSLSSNPDENQNQRSDGISYNSNPSGNQRFLETDQFPTTTVRTRKDILGSENHKNETVDLNHSPADAQQKSFSESQIKSSVPFQQTTLFKNNSVNTTVLDASNEILGVTQPLHLFSDASDHNILTNPQNTENSQAANAPFSVMLQNLEKKVENIADLVKKTCGKLNPEVLEDLKETGKSQDSAFVQTKSSFPNHQADHLSPLVDQNLSQVTANHDAIDSGVSTISQVEQITISPDSDPRLAKAHVNPHIVNDADALEEMLNKNTKSLVNSARNIADLIQTNVDPKISLPEIMQTNSAAAPNDVNQNLFTKSEETVACSKEDSSEYLGAVPKSTASHSKDYSEEADRIQQKSDSVHTVYQKPTKIDLRSGYQEENLSTTTKTNISANDAKNSDIGGNKESSKLIQKPSNNLTSTKREFSKNNENVGCSKEYSEEYIGKPVSSATSNNDTVGCSKEDEESYLPDYRESESSSTSNFPSSNLHRERAPLSSPTLNKSSYHPQILRKYMLHPSQENKETVPSITPLTDPQKTSRQSVSSKNAEAWTPNAQKDTDSDPFNEARSQVSRLHESNQHPQNLNVDPFSQTVNQPVRSTIPNSQHSGSIKKSPELNVLPHKYYSTAPPIITSSRTPFALQPELPVKNFEPFHLQKSSLPSLQQRFAEEHKPEHAEKISANGFHLHRPTSLPDWPKLQKKDDIVRAKIDWLPYDSTEELSVETSTLTSPLSSFGKVVPQLNNKKASSDTLPSNKVYFMGNGMRLPLNVKKGGDGSYHLSVDVDKLCNSCTDGLCKNKTNITAATPLTSGGSQAELTQDNSKAIFANLRYQEQNQEETRKPSQLNTQKINISSAQTPELHQRQTFNSKETLNNADATIPYTKKLPQDLRTSSRHAQLSKRSPSFQLLLPNLKPTDQPEKNFRQRNNKISGDNDEFKNGLSDSSYSLDENLNRIQTYIRQYYNQHREPHNSYRNKNKFDHEHPTEKRDVVKYRVSLVNNVLSWMKSIAIQDAHG